MMENRNINNEMEKYTESVKEAAMIASYAEGASRQSTLPDCYNEFAMKSVFSEFKTKSIQKFYPNSNAASTKNSNANPITPSTSFGYQRNTLRSISPAPQKCRLMPRIEHKMKKTPIKNKLCKLLQSGPLIKEIIVAYNNN